MNLGHVQSVAVFRALQLGDMLCSIPALRALRTGFPSARITLVGLPSAAALLDHYPGLVDELLPFPGAPGMPEQPARADELGRFFATMRARRFDIAIQLHGSGEVTNPIVARLGARRMAGFVPPGMPAPSGFVPWPRALPEPLRYLRLTRALGLPDDGPALDFPLHAADEDEASALLAASGLLAGEYICLHAGARLASRRWPLANFARVGRCLVGRGWPLVLTGSADEVPLVAELRGALGGADPENQLVHDFAGRSSLGGMAALVANSRLLVSNDTGVSHIAAGLRHPSVIIASGSDVCRWAPLDAHRHRVLWSDAPCRPCAFDRCPHGHRCAWDVTPPAVLAAIDAQLERFSHAVH